MSLENIPRLRDSVNYFFTTESGEVLTLVEAVAGVGAEEGDWYKFVYENVSGIHTIEVDDNLGIRMKDGTLLLEPFSKIKFQLPEIRLSLLIYTNSKEDFFRGSAKVHLSETQDWGLISTESYQRAENLLGDRLLGAVNMKLVRTTNGLQSVESCVVNQGEVPEF